jgi:hypothetical protein
MSIEFFNTRMGRKFYESDVPRIAKALERIADAMTQTHGPATQGDVVARYNYFAAPGVCRHVPDWRTVSKADTEDLTTYDVTCGECGLSGAFILDGVEIDW